MQAQEQVIKTRADFAFAKWVSAAFCFLFDLVSVLSQSHHEKVNFLLQIAASPKTAYRVGYSVSQDSC